MEVGRKAGRLKGLKMVCLTICILTTAQSDARSPANLSAPPVCGVEPDVTRLCKYAQRGAGVLLSLNQTRLAKQSAENIGSGAIENCAGQTRLG